MSEFEKWLESDQYKKLCKECPFAAMLVLPYALLTFAGEDIIKVVQASE